MTRFSIYKNGYVHEDSSITDPIMIKTFFWSCAEAEMWLAKFCLKHKVNKSDYHILEEEKTHIGWVTIEGSEIYF